MPCAWPGLAMRHAALAQVAAQPRAASAESRASTGLHAAAHRGDLAALASALAARAPT